jgi:predicted nucleotidyltransferase
MADKRKTPLERVAEVLIKHGVEFIVIGGQAESLYGSPRVTYDVDLCYRRTPENLERLARALPQFQPRLRGVPPGLPLMIDARALALGNNYTFETNIIDLDLLGWVEPLGDFEAVAKKAVTLPVAGMQLRVIDLDDLIRIKEHLGRIKDADSRAQLHAIKKIREEQKK